MTGRCKFPEIPRDPRVEQRETLEHHSQLDKDSITSAFWLSRTVRVCYI